MNLWIDADACPRPVKEIVFRASNRLGLKLILVANGPVPHPESPLIETVCVEKVFDAADSYIAQALAPDDIVVTADIPLAAEVVRRGATAIDPRGDLYNEETIGGRLSFRNLITDLRDQGVIQGSGPKPFSLSDRTRFAAALDRLLAQRLRKASCAK